MEQKTYSELLKFAIGRINKMEGELDGVLKVTPMSAARESLIKIKNELNLFKLILKLKTKKQ